MGANEAMLKKIRDAKEREEYEREMKKFNLFVYGVSKEIGPQEPRKRGRTCKD